MVCDLKVIGIANVNVNVNVNNVNIKSHYVE